LVRQLRRYYTRCGKVLDDLSTHLVGYREDDKTSALFGKTRIVLHNTSGPAVTFPSGYKAFWIHGLRHKIDGPAIQYSSGKGLFYLFNKRYDEKQYKQMVKKLIKTNAVEYLLDDNPNIRMCAEETVRILQEKNKKKKRKRGR
jgi:hypothetical protein